MKACITSRFSALEAIGSAPDSIQAYKDSLSMIHLLDIIKNLDALSEITADAAPLGVAKNKYVSARAAMARANAASSS